MFDLKTRILIVDDMLTMRKIITKICREIGFQDIQEASDGNKAWEIIQASNPPLGMIISDWNMPVCTGVDLLKRVRADERFKHTPFMLVTAEAEQHQILEAVKSGVDQYLVKPFTKDSIKEKLEIVHKKYSTKKAV